MSKINNISGFPEWLPQQKILEDKVIKTIRNVYESYGFTPIETPAVELISTLASKGVVDKEIYVLKRAKEEGEEQAQLGLHFDLTVPLARYVAQHFGSLSFPFKRYQLQKVWRGERPQKGRFREFYQFDIDTIALDELPLSCDAEIVSAVAAVFSQLKIGSFKIRINSRKILYGIYSGLGLDSAQQKAAIIAVDKLGKIGAAGVTKELLEIGLNQVVAGKILELTNLSATYKNIEAVLSSLHDETDLYKQGRQELLTFAQLISDSAKESLLLDMSLARGLDYYTGLIYEVVFDDYPEFGSVCSGGRYDNLASQFTNKKLPGVGVSIGLSRLMELVFSKNLLPLSQKSLTQVFVAVYSEDQRAFCNAKAEELRSYGLKCEVYFKSPKLGKQIDYAVSREIPYMLFVTPEGGLEVKDLISKEQKPITDLKSWSLGVLSLSAVS